MEAERVRGQLDRVLTSTTFAGADRAGNFLRFVANRALDGRIGEIKESVIAVEALGRNPSFDPKSDPVVRDGAVYGSRGFLSGAWRRRGIRPDPCG